jgi:lactoylglutathione lyase
MIRNIKTVAIYVEEQDRALAFYTEKLDFKVYLDQPRGPKMRWVEVAPPDAQSHLVIFPRTMMPDWEQKKPSVVLACDDADATFRELSKRGVIFTDPPKRMPFGTFGVFVDADGNQLAIMSPNK